MRVNLPGVLQRIEYFYRDRNMVLAPKLDGPKKFGTYGMIEVTVAYYYPTTLGKLYHPVDNPQEAAWWLDFYKKNGEVNAAFFVPSVDQRATNFPFVEPDLGVLPDEEDPASGWYVKPIDEYTK